MITKHQWQEVCDETEGAHTQCTSRMKVEGGWLYRFESLVPVSNDSCQSNVAMEFVPDSPPKVQARKKYGLK